MSDFVNPFPKTDEVTSFVVTGARTNIDGSKVLVATVTYDDASTETWEVLPLRVVPS